MAKELEDLHDKTVKDIKINSGEHNLYIEFTDGTTLEVGLDCYDYDRYRLEIDIYKF